MENTSFVDLFVDEMRFFKFILDKEGVNIFPDFSFVAGLPWKFWILNSFMGDYVEHYLLGFNAM